MGSQRRFAVKPPPGKPSTLYQCATEARIAGEFCIFRDGERPNIFIGKLRRTLRSGRRATEPPIEMRGCVPPAAR